eukprot:CAMPEP_0119051144 /NCGR_PEP_ID=MMETSP1177-20130426/72861_1 /TAXON_ID=2985 /ORGANISM="Ochromonas sp, Strain CCMP1899" /LENGTH=323 /DNA_ID=CAMNT_0007030253 /DNA_START=659 /DNA_END=1630 /DNA_ORIENTATION=-
MIISDDDARDVNNPRGESPWRKPLKEYQKKHANPGFGNIRRTEIHSVNKTWTLVDDDRCQVTAGLIAHRIPCFGFVVKEVDKAGPLLPEECAKRKVHQGHFIDLKLGKNISLSDGTVIYSRDVTGPSIKGRKLVVLGDTSDASNMISLGKDCDLLIHESTAEDEREGIMGKNGHATPSVATQMALQCNAKKLILNHIGSRFVPMRVGFQRSDSVELVKSDLDLLYQAKRGLGRPNDVCIARDFVTFKIPIGGYTDADLNTGFTYDGVDPSKEDKNYFVDKNSNLTFKIPIGGYTDADLNTGFTYDGVDPSKEDKNYKIDKRKY